MISVKESSNYHETYHDKKRIGKPPSSNNHKFEVIINEPNEYEKANEIRNNIGWSSWIREKLRQEITIVENLDALQKEQTLLEIEKSERDNRLAFINDRIIFLQTQKKEKEDLEIKEKVEAEARAKKDYDDKLKNFTEFAKYEGLTNSEIEELFKLYYLNKKLFGYPELINKFREEDKSFRAIELFIKNKGGVL